MAKTLKDDKERIITMIKNIDFCSENIKNIAGKDFNVDLRVQYALCMALQIICENANHISKDTKSNNKEIAWNDISKTRNVISHEYGALNLTMIYETIVKDLPILKQQLEKMLNKIELEMKSQQEILPKYINATKYGNTDHPKLTP